MADLLSDDALRALAAGQPVPTPLTPEAPPVATPPQQPPAPAVQPSASPAPALVPHPRPATPTPLDDATVRAMVSAPGSWAKPQSPDSLARDPGEVRDDATQSAGFLTNLGATTMLVPEQKILWYASQRFPNEPIDSAVRRYGVKDGRVFYKGLDGLRYFEDAGLGASAAQGIADTAFSVVPGIAGFALAGGPASPVTGAAGGMLGAAAGEAARQAIGEQLSGAQASALRKLQAITGEAALDAVSTGAGSIIIKGVSSKAFKELARSGQQTAQQLMQTARDRFGIDLTWAEASGLRSLLNRQSYVQRLGAAADTMQGRYLKRQTQIDGAVDDFLKAISPQGSTVQAGDDVVRAADRYLREEADKVTRATAPRYSLAYSGRPSVDGASIVAAIDAEAPTATGDFAKLLKRYKGEIAELGERGEVKRTTLPTEKLHNLRKDLDYDISNVIDGKLDIPKDRIRGLAALRDEIDAVLKADPEFRDADSLFERMIKPVTEARRSTIGGIAKQPRGTNTMATRIFKGADSDEFVIRDVMDKISSVDPAAWDAIVRSHLQQAMDSAKGTTRIGEIRDIGGRFAQAVWGDGTGKQARMIRVALAARPDVKETFETLMDVLSATGKALYEGSPTERYLRVGAEMANEAAGASPALKYGGGIAQFAAPDALPRLTAAFKNMAEGRYNAKFAEALWDPEFQKAMNYLRSVGPKTQVGLQGSIRFLTNWLDSVTGASENLGTTVRSEFGSKPSGASAPRP